MAEDTAGIGRIVADAFLIRHTVLGSMHKILCGSDQTNDREEPEGYSKVSAVVVVIAQILTKIRAYVLGYVARATTAGAAFLHVLHYLYAKNDGINHLNNGLGHVLFPTNCYRRCTEIIAALTGFEDVDVALAAV